MIDIILIVVNILLFMFILYLIYTYKFKKYNIIGLYVSEDTVGRINKNENLGGVEHALIFYKNKNDDIEALKILLLLNNTKIKYDTRLETITYIKNILMDVIESEGHLSYDKLKKMNVR